MIEKGAEIGAHILSGAVMDPRAFDELMPDWKQAGAPLNAPVTEDRFYFLSETGGLRVPNMLLPAMLPEPRQYVITSGRCVPLAGQAGGGARRRDLSGFRRPPKCCTTRTARCKGVATGNMGVGRDGNQAGDSSSAWNCSPNTPCLPKARAATSASSCSERFDLRDDGDPQVYGIGIKELWEIDPDKHNPAW